MLWNDVQHISRYAALYSLCSSQYNIEDQPAFMEAVRDEKAEY